MIYFIQETGWFRNRVKIGTTSDIRKRLCDLRGVSPSELKVVLVLTGTYGMEAIYHERFTQYRLHGEWFKLGFQLRLFLWINKCKSLKLYDGVMSRLGTREIAIVERFREYIKGLDGDKPSWRQATVYSFNNKSHYGPHYTTRLKKLLDKVGYDYQEYLPDNPPENISS